MKNEKWEPMIRWGITAFMVLASSAAIIYFIFNFNILRGAAEKLFDILAPIIYGMILAYLVAPIYNGTVDFLKPRLRKTFPAGTTARTITKVAATIISIFFIVIMAVGLVSMIIPELYKSISNLIATGPESFSAFYANALASFADNEIIRNILTQIYDWVNSMMQMENLTAEHLLGNLRNIASSISGGIWASVVWFKNIFIGIIVMAYLLNIKEELLRQIRKAIYAMFSTRSAQGIIDECMYINQVFGGFILGKILDSLIIGVICFAVLWFLNAIHLTRMPYVLLISVIIGLTNVIPFFGPFVGAIPCFILILLVSPLQSLWFLVFILILQQIDGNIIGPRILGNSTGLSSFWVLFSILLLGGLFGFVGMIIAVPTWAVLMNFFRRFVEHRLSEKKMELRQNNIDFQTEEEKRRLAP